MYDNVNVIRFSNHGKVSLLIDVVANQVRGICKFRCYVLEVPYLALYRMICVCICILRYVLECGLV